MTEKNEQAQGSESGACAGPSEAELSERLGEERRLFEKWYTLHAFDLARNPVGSRECHLQWLAWQGALKAHEFRYHDVEQFLEDD